jgi:hypothetical protein
LEIVEMRDPSPLRVVDLELKLEGLLGPGVDVLTLEDAGANPVLLAEAVADGRTIVDREERWAQLSSEAKAMDSRAGGICAIAAAMPLLGSTVSSLLTTECKPPNGPSAGCRTTWSSWQRGGAGWRSSIFPTP